MTIAQFYHHLAISMRAGLAPPFLLRFPFARRLLRALHLPERRP